jgi:hypothetical protein
MSETFDKWEKRCIRNALHRSEHNAFKYLGYAGGYWELVEGPNSDPLVVMKNKGRSLTDEDVETLRDMKANSKRKREDDDREFRERSNARQKLRTDDDELRAKEAPALKWSVYQISQTANVGYETFTDAMVVATSEEEAKLVHPSGSPLIPRGWWAAKTYVDLLASWKSRHDWASGPADPMPAWYTGDDEWCHPLFVKATLICSYDGDIDKRGRVLCSSSTGC